jgi:hypothetical protein
VVKAFVAQQAALEAAQFEASVERAARQHERKRRLRPIEFQLSGCGDVMKRRAVGSSSGTTRRGPYAPSACWA